MIRWSKPDKYNATCKCATHMMIAWKTHYDAMIHLMYYCVITPESGLVLKSYGNYHGISTDYKFEVTVKTECLCKMPRY